MKNSGRTCCVATVALSLGVNIPFAQAADVKTKLLEICRMTIDMPGESQKLEEAVMATGEEGRRELLRLADSTRPEASCALDHLVTTLQDKRAIPIIRKVLKNRRAATQLKAEALVGVKTFTDVESFEGAMEAFKSGHEELVGPAAYALAALRDERGLRVLREALLDPRYSRFMIADAVGFRGHEAAVEPLLGMMGDQVVAKSETIRSGLALSLARIGVPRSRVAAVDLLLEGLEDKWFHRKLSEDLSMIFVHQRMNNQDPQDLADIEKQMARLRDDPDAPPSVKERK